MRTVGLGHSTRSDAEDAAGEASARAVEALGGGVPSAAVVVSTGAYGGEAAARKLVARACRELGTFEIAGAALDGLMVGAAEWTAEPAVAVLALADGGAGVALLEEVAGHEEALAGELASAFDAAPEPGDLLVLFAEAQAIDGHRAARGLQGLGASAVAGMAAGEATGESQPVWAGDEVVRGGLAALRIPGASAVRGAGGRVALTQAGRPLGEPMRITRSRGHWISALDDRPALDVYRDAVPAPLRRDLARAARTVLVSLEDRSGPRGHRRRVRNVVGFDAERGAFSVAEPPGPGDRLALVALDPAAAREELGRLEARLSGPAPAGALYLNCRARARALFDHEGYELGRVEGILGGCPVLGLMGSHLYAREDERAALELHTYAALAALIDA